MQTALAIKLEEDMGKVVAGSAASQRLVSEAKRKSTQIVDLATNYTAEASRLQNAARADHT